MRKGLHNTQGTAAVISMVDEVLYVINSIYTINLKTSISSKKAGAISFSTRLYIRRHRPFRALIKGLPGLVPAMPGIKPVQGLRITVVLEQAMAIGVVFLNTDRLAWLTRGE
jgi:hypothetical protein